MSCRPAGMGWGWGENLRGWGGDGDKPCGDGAGMGKTYLLRGGDGDEIVSPCHSLLWRPFLQENKTFALRQFPKTQDFRFETVSKKSRNDLETETEGSETETETSKKPVSRRLETETIQL